MWNLKDKTEKRNRLIDMENKVVVPRGMGVGETGKGTQKHKLPVTK